MISIAMATYNGAKYIREQLDSILGQSISDFELVICDDCSTDDTYSILKQYAEKDSRITIHKNEKNLGYKRNFEKVIQLTKGEYVALCDQDDIWANNHLEVLLNGIEDKMISAGNSDLIDANGYRIGLTLQQMEAFGSFPKDELLRALSFMLFRNPIQGAAMLIRRDFLKKALPIPDGVDYHDAWFSVFSCFWGGMSYADIIVNGYRMHENNVTGHRVQAKSRFKHLLRSVRHDLSYDRAAMIPSIRARLDNPTEAQLQVLNKCEQIVNRNKSFFGRFINALYRVRYYKIIYTV
jgi:glycosyltransferase involved in cell wall biosynthesis